MYSIATGRKGTEKSEGKWPLTRLKRSCGRGGRECRNEWEVRSYENGSKSDKEMSTDDEGDSVPFEFVSQITGSCWWMESADVENSAWHYRWWLDSFGHKKMGECTLRSAWGKKQKAYSRAETTTTNENPRAGPNQSAFSPPLNYVSYILH